jgi:hypothetical protein
MQSPTRPLHRHSDNSKEFGVAARTEECVSSMRYPTVPALVNQPATEATTSVESGRSSHVDASLQRDSQCRHDGIGTRSATNVAN